MILLTVDEDPAVIQHTLGILRKAGGSHEVHTASNLAVAQNSSSKLQQLDVLICPVIVSDGESFIPLRDSLRDRFPKLHVLFLNDYEVDGHADKIGDDPVLPRKPGEAELLAWAGSIGLGKLPDAPHTPTPQPPSEHLFDGSPAKANHEIPIAAPAVDDGEDDEELPVAGLVTTPSGSLGDYKLVRVIASHQQTETHEAVQLSIGRTVALVLLKPAFCKNTEAVREFRGAVRAKASITHPNITPVYEAHEADGAIFYTRELVEGLNIPQLSTTGKKINQRALIQIVKITAECIKFMESSGTKHDDLSPRHVFLGQDAQVRINNIANLSPRNTSTAGEDIANLASAIRPLVSEKSSESNLILPLLAEMKSLVYEDWGSLLKKAQELETRVEEGLDYSAGSRFGNASISKKTILLTAIGALVVSAIAAFVIIPKFTRSKPLPAGEMQRIPAGDFIYQDGTDSIEKPFWIDKYEVTIAQYAEFLEELEDSPTDEFDDVEQAVKAPDKKDHIPDDWDAYYAAALEGAMFRGSIIDVNCPIVLVDWWDAYAYAKWKGHRLPTEIEWSKAARGADGNVFPWGNELEAEDFKRFNSSDPGADSFERWCPVDAMAGDESPYGVIGTAGNVSEWTDSWDTHPDFPDRSVPIVRGGNFASEVERYPLKDRRHSNSANDRSVLTGFRTVTNIDPTLN